MSVRLRLFVLPVLALALLVPASAADLITNPDFAKNADGWPLPAGASWEAEGFVRLKTDGGKTVSIYRAVPLNGAESVTLTYRVRYEGVRRGSEGWHDARIIINLKDGNGQQLTPRPPHPHFKGTSDGWVEKSIVIPVPAGAETLEVMFGLFQAEAGTLDVDTLRLTAP